MRCLHSVVFTLAKPFHFLSFRFFSFLWLAMPNSSHHSILWHSICTWVHFANDHDGMNLLSELHLAPSKSSPSIHNKCLLPYHVNFFRTKTYSHKQNIKWRFCFHSIFVFKNRNHDCHGWCCHFIQLPNKAGKNDEQSLKWAHKITPKRAANKKKLVLILQASKFTLPPRL